MFILALCFIILKFRFPSNKPITGTIRNKYGEQAVHNFRKLETLWRKRDKTLCNIDFNICYYSNITPKFLGIKVYRHHLQSTSRVRDLERKLLETEQSSKGKH